jgi:hypothetical protein
MLKRILAPVCLALVAFAGSLSQAAPASAAGRASFVINNTSSVAINYLVEWSDGDVQEVTLAAGESMAHSVTLNSQNRMPIPVIVFDCVGGDGDYTEARYELDAYTVGNPHDGKEYSFVYASNGVVLNLYED